MLSTRRNVALAALLLLGACGPKKPTGAEVCAKMTSAGLAANCREAKPGGLGAAAIENYAFDLPSVKGKTGQIMRFEKPEYYTTTVSAYQGAAAIAGPHRYGSEKALIFVQLNDGASLDVGKKTKALVDALLRRREVPQARAASWARPYTVTGVSVYGA